MAGKWQETTLGEVIELKRGYDLPKRERFPGPVPLVSSSGVTDYHTASKVAGPGVVTGRYGTLGEVFFVREDFWPLNTTLYVRDFKSNNPRFISYFLKSIDFLPFSDKAAVPGLNRNHLHQAPVWFPDDVNEQRAIAHILGTLDDKIELNRRMNETLEAMARALFKDWFVDFGPTRAKIEGRDPYLAPETWDLFPDKLDEDGKPEGWTAVGVGEVVELLDSKRIPLSSREREKRRGLFPYHGATGVMDYVNDFLFDEILLLVGEDGSVARPNGRPFTQYVWGKIWVNNHAHVLRGVGVSVEQLKCFFDRVDIGPYVTGAVQPKLNQANLKRVQFPKASPKLHQSLDGIIQPWFARIRLNDDEAKILAQTRDLLLPKLMSGEVRVGDVDKFVQEST